MTAPVFFGDATAVRDAVAGDRIRLAGDEGRHAADVRRLRAGESIDLTDGAGVMLHGVVAEARRGEVVVEVRGRVDTPAPTPRLTVAQALARGGRDEQAVEAMTEVGVDHVVGWEAARSVAKWTDRTQAKWTSTSRAATKQSRRAWSPQISGPASMGDLAALLRGADLAVVLHEQATEPLSGLAQAGMTNVVIVVGPEGGIDDGELGVLREAGGQVVRLGDTVLRSSAAGVAALAVICAATRWV